jgi:solute carrier family 25 carnitine/acylcarnitine transporter 20/29
MSPDFWAGYISGAVGIIIGNPLDLIKVRLQAGASNTVRTPSSYANQFESAGALIRGATAPILGYGALNALLFMSYNRTTALLNGSEDSTARSLWGIWLAGAIGGLATWVVSTPTELIKCRAQMATQRTSSIGITKEILRQEGVRGLYFGGVVTALRDSIGYGFYFWAYELSTKILTSKTQESPSQEAAKVLLCGGLAGVVTWASVFPLDVIKTRVQTQTMDAETPVRRETAPLLSEAAASSANRRRIGALEMAKTTYRTEGFGVFWRGLTVCSVRAFVVNAAQWAVYEWIMKELGAKDRTAKLENMTV